MSKKTPHDDTYRPNWKAFTSHLDGKSVIHRMYLGLCILEVEKVKGYWQPQMRYGSMITSPLVVHYIKSICGKGQTKFRNVEKAKSAAIGLFVNVAEGLVRDVKVAGAEDILKRETRA